MRSIISTSALAALLASGAVQAGGLDRSGQDTSIIFKEGGLFEVTSVSVKPTVSGINAGYNTATGDVAPDYSMTTMGLRADINDSMAVAIIKDNPYGADVSWTNATLSGTEVSVGSSATTALLSYNASDAVTVYGGIISQSVDATLTSKVSNPAIGGGIAGGALNYQLTSTASSATGYVMGTAFEKPEIALRVALTYHTKVKHNMAIQETCTSPLGYCGTTAATSMNFYMPSAYNLDFQTGIAANTLLFGSIRRANWTETKLVGGLYPGQTIKEYTDDTTVYSIGLGRKLNDQWSIAATYGWEKATGERGSALGPTDGNSNYGLGATYTADQLSVTVGARQISFGDTPVDVSGSQAAAMADNKGLLTAVKLAYKF